ncbi:MAG TPA: ATP-binding cassette domain-containing protein [Gemmatimonadaceae bacterium]|nr:ATP-binding cassette domain-containing protein [Gemmatimonadaceae bacterium]
MNDLAVDIRGVQKGFDGHTAVKDLSLAVPRGSVYGLLGPNGAGKTTTIRMILNVIVPDQGTISVLGRPNGDTAVTDRIGYLPEERGLYRKMRVRRVLRFLGELKGMNRRDVDRRIDEWLARLNLTEWDEKKVDELSRGMQQKVQFIGTLLHDPELVILDEPFSGLDPINAQALNDTVLELRQRGRTVIFSTHLMDNAERLCDSVCIIAKGTKVLDGPVAQVRAENAGRTIALALMNGTSEAVSKILADKTLIDRVDNSNKTLELELAANASAKRLLEQLVGAGADITRFEIVQPSLHKIFLQRVGAVGVAEGMSGHG